ncbi:MAG: ATPase P [Dorea sp.]|jgi:soluble P-type ATPase|nr:ATPase P [Dorea sp.]
MKIDIPGFKILELEYLILDYNGTIAADGMIPEDIVRRLKMLAEKFRIYIVTADTHGNAREACAKLPVEVYTFPSRDAAHAKRELVEKLGSERCICVGNGRNDMLMFQIAALSVAVMDAEGMYGRLGEKADVCVRSMQEGLDLLVKEKRLIATLRG